MSNQGYKVFAMDLSLIAIENDYHKIQNKLVNPVSFVTGDVTHEQNVNCIIDKARNGSSTVNIYCRFFIHTLDDEQERMFLIALSISGTIV